MKILSPKGNQSWIFIGRIDAEAVTPITLATWCEELTHLKRSWCWERLKAEREGDDRWWNGWMASLTQWTWVWVSSRSWWWTGKPGMLQSMGLQRVGHDWATELILVAYFQFHSQQSHFKPNVSKLNRSLNIQQKYPQWGSPHGMQYEKDTESDSGNHKALLSIRLTHSLSRRLVPHSYIPIRWTR